MTTEQEHDLVGRLRQNRDLRERLDRESEKARWEMYRLLKEAVAHGMSVSRTCREVGVSRKTYYKRINTEKLGGTK